MFLNADVPEWHCFLRAEFLYDCDPAYRGQVVPVCVFGIASVAGRALGFHVLVENGAQIARVPLHALTAKRDAPARPLPALQLWNCFSYEVAVTEYEYLQEMRVRAYLGDRTVEPGTYCFTIDWCGSASAEAAGPGGHKCAHVIALDDGNYAALPNNRLQWLEPSCGKPWKERPDYRINTHTWKVEDGDQMLTEDSDRFFYHMSQTTAERVLALHRGGGCEFTAECCSLTCAQPAGHDGQHDWQRGA